MIMQNICPNAGPCPIFNGILQDKVITARSYKAMYCEAGEVQWNRCKRYMTKKEFGSCPSDLLPNTALTLEQIGEKYHLTKN